MINQQYMKDKGRLEDTIRRQVQWAMAAQTRQLPSELKSLMKKGEDKAKAKAHMC